MIYDMTYLFLVQLTWTMPAGVCVGVGVSGSEGGRTDADMEV